LEDGGDWTGRSLVSLGADFADWKWKEDVLMRRVKLIWHSVV